MTNLELIQQLLKRLKKFSLVILALGLILAGVFYYAAKKSLMVYTAKATVFPLNSSTDNTISSSTISNILGLSDAPKSFSGEASINILELATSRRTRDAVAEHRVPSMGNKTISQLLIEENNKHVGFMQNSEIKMPKDSLHLINLASGLLKGGFQSKINKNGILELYFTNTDQDIVREVTYVYIEKLSSFYIELKKKKAQIDYEFAVKKADSLSTILDHLDRRAVALDESTFFTNEELKRYNLPKQNLAQDKSTVQSQYYYAVNNREAAAYKLQKETPIIEALDRPEPPYDVTQKSKMLYGIIGFLLGCAIGVGIFSWKIISRYIGDELNKAIEKAAKGKAPVAEQA
jgi:hypothetical protein